MALPPEIPLTEKDLTDPLLIPLPGIQVETWSEDGWEVITDRASFAHHSLIDVIQWLMMPANRVDITHAYITRHSEGEVR